MNSSELRKIADGAGLPFQTVYHRHRKNPAQSLKSLTGPLRGTRSMLHAGFTSEQWVKQLARQLGFSTTTARVSSYFGYHSQKGRTQDKIAVLLIHHAARATGHKAPPETQG